MTQLLTAAYTTAGTLGRQGATNTVTPDGKLALQLGNANKGD